MAVCFNQGAEVGRGDLDIFFTSQSTGNPTNVYSISYALYCIDPGTGQEILIGSPARTPVNPQVGEYYAALQIPPNAAIGDYVIRWVFKRTAADPEEGAVMEFCVVGNSVSTSSESSLGPCEAELVSRLRFLLRDKCVGGEEIVELDVAGERMLVRMDDLFDVLRGMSPPPPGKW